MINKVYLYKLIIVALVTILVRIELIKIFFDYGFYFLTNLTSSFLSSIKGAFFILAILFIFHLIIKTGMFNLFWLTILLIGVDVFTTTQLHGLLIPTNYLRVINVISVAVISTVCHYLWHSHSR